MPKLQLVGRAKFGRTNFPDLPVKLQAHQCCQCTSCEYLHNLRWGKCPFRLLEWPLSPPTGKRTLGFGADFLHDFISATGKSRKYSFFVILELKLLLPCILKYVKISQRQFIYKLNPFFHPTNAL